MQIRVKSTQYIFHVGDILNMQHIEKLIRAYMIIAMILSRSDNGIIMWIDFIGVFPNLTRFLTVSLAV